MTGQRALSNYTFAEEYGNNILDKTRVLAFWGSALIPHSGDEISFFEQFS